MGNKLAVALLLGLLLCTSHCLAGSAFREGMIDETLQYEGFEVKDGFITGYLINTANTPRRGFKLDMWTTNPQETRIYWRKSITVGDLGPKAKVLIKEQYTVEVEDPLRLKVMFRLPNPANYRN